MYDQDDNSWSVLLSKAREYLLCNDSYPSWSIDDDMTDCSGSAITATMKSSSSSSNVVSSSSLIKKRSLVGVAGRGRGNEMMVDVKRQKKSDVNECVAAVCRMAEQGGATYALDLVQWIPDTLHLLPETSNTMALDALIDIWSIAHIILCDDEDNNDTVAKPAGSSLASVDLELQDITMKLCDQHGLIWLCRFITTCIAHSGPRLMYILRRLSDRNVTGLLAALHGLCVVQRYRGQEPLDEAMAMLCEIEDTYSDEAAYVLTLLLNGDIDERLLGWAAVQALSVAVSYRTTSFTLAGRLSRQVTPAAVERAFIAAKTYGGAAECWAVMTTIVHDDKLLESLSVGDSTSSSPLLDAARLLFTIADRNGEAAEDARLLVNALLFRLERSAYCSGKKYTPGMDTLSSKISSSAAADAAALRALAPCAQAAMWPFDGAKATAASIRDSRLLLSLCSNHESEAGAVNALNEVLLRPNRHGNDGLLSYLALREALRSPYPTSHSTAVASLLERAEALPLPVLARLLKRLERLLSLEQGSGGDGGAMSNVLSMLWHAVFSQAFHQDGTIASSALRLCAGALPNSLNRLPADKALARVREVSALFLWLMHRRHAVMDAAFMNNYPDVESDGKCTGSSESLPLNEILRRLILCRNLFQKNCQSCPAVVPSLLGLLLSAALDGDNTVLFGRSTSDNGGMVDALAETDTASDTINNDSLPVTLAELGSSLLLRNRHIETARSQRAPHSGVVGRGTLRHGLRGKRDGDGTIASQACEAAECVQAWCRAELVAVLAAAVTCNESRDNMLDNMDSLASHLLRHVTPLVEPPSDAQYIEVLPKYSGAEHDLVVWRCFSRFPFLWHVLRLLSREPRVFLRAVCVIKALLAGLIARWHALTPQLARSRGPSTFEQFRPSQVLPQTFEDTTLLLNCLAEAQWLPAPLSRCGEAARLLPCCDLVTLLRCVFRFLIAHPPAEPCQGDDDNENQKSKHTFPTTCHDLYMGELRAIFCRNIGNIGPLYQRLICLDE